MSRIGLLKQTYTEIFTLLNERNLPDLAHTCTSAHFSRTPKAEAKNPKHIRSWNGRTLKKRGSAAPPGTITRRHKLPGFADILQKF